MNPRKKINIIGGGLSGLACAVTLQRKGIPFTLIEKSESWGGRIKTEVHSDGFLLDAGFQVLLNSYPELPNFFDFESLKLRPFASGAQIYNGHKLLVLANPLRHPEELFRTAFTSLASFRDKALLLKLVASLLQGRMSDPQTALPPSERMTTLQYVRNFGFSKPFLEQFWLPFFTGIYLDPDLNADAGFFLFLLRCFSFGQATLPAEGMAALPRQLVAQLNPASLRLGSEEPADLNSTITVRAFAKPSELVRSATTYYFATAEKLYWGKWLVLIPPHLNFQINQLAHLNAVAEHYAPAGQNLISATVVRPGARPELKIVQSEIEKIAGRSLSLRHLKTDEITHALPEYRVGAPGFLKEGDAYQCGDHLSNPSTNGALQSGRLAAEDIIKHYVF